MLNMKRRPEPVATVGAFLAGLLFVLAPSAPVSGQQLGGVLRMSHFDSPASMSMHEESTAAVNRPMMGVFNNLIMYRQDAPQNTSETIMPDLATGWSWNEDATELTLPLRRDVKWHDGKPFTARDVKCTWDLLTGKAAEKFRLNPRKSWYANLEEVTVNGDYEVTFRLKRPQPSFIALLAAGWSPVYPCHVPPRDMRLKPIGTGPFKFVEFKPNELIRVAKNPDYWKPGRPFLDGIEYTIIKNQSTGALSFVAGTVDMTSPYFLQVPMLADIKAQVPQASCALVPTNVQRNVMINREALPFNKPDMRRAVALTVDRRAFIETLTQGKGDIGGALLAPPEGIWGMPAELMQKLPGYDPDVEKNRTEARKIMETAGYGPGNRLKLKVSTRNIPPYRDPAVILLDQLKRIYIDAELELLDTTAWYPKVRRRDYTIGANLTGNGIDDPDQAFYENYACDSESNYDGYCNT